MKKDNVKTGGFYLVKRGKINVGMKVETMDDEGVVDGRDELGNPITAKANQLLWELSGGFKGERIDSPDAAPDPKAAKAKKAAANKKAREDAKATMKKNKDARKAKKAGKKAAPVKAKKAKSKTGKSDGSRKSSKKIGELSLREHGIAVLKRHRGKTMSAQAIIDELAERKEWKTRSGASPERTLYTSLMRELDKGASSAVAWEKGGGWSYNADGAARALAEKGNGKPAEKTAKKKPAKRKQKQPKTKGVESLLNLRLTDPHSKGRT